MSSISPMMLEILADDCVIRSIASVACCITSPPSSAVLETAAALLLADSARLALSITVRASCSIAAEVSSIVAACLVVRSLRSLAPDRISPVAVFEPARGAAHFAHHLGHLVGHRVGVVLELAERALILALDPLGQVGIGQRVQHLAGLGQPALHIVEQPVEHVGNAIEALVAEIGRDAAREIAPHRRAGIVGEVLAELVAALLPLPLVLRCRIAPRRQLGPVEPVPPGSRAARRPASPSR